jgi:hypothetical protein
MMAYVQFTIALCFHNGMYRLSRTVLPQILKQYDSSQLRKLPTKQKIQTPEKTWIF